MGSSGVDIDRIVDRINEVILERPETVVIGFLLATVVFAGGMTMVTTEVDATDAFIEDIPEQQALDAINDRFGDPFEPTTPSTQLIHVADNVLDREELIRMLTVIERADDRTDLRVEGAAGPAPLIAQTIDPSATTPREQRRAVERATPGEIRAAVNELEGTPAFRNTLSDDFNPNSATASTSVTVLSHDLPEGADSGDIEEIQLEIATLTADVPSDIRVFGAGIINNEFVNIIGDSLLIVIPVVLVLILGFLMIAYRDPIDLALGLVALLMSIVWTFGFVGLLGIPFDQIMIAVPVLLLAVGIDFGIHIINRFREERQSGYVPIDAMRGANRQLLVAFFIVTVTTMIGFGANVVSDLGPIRSFGFVASMGMFFTFIIFGLFLPAAKLTTDDLRERWGIPIFNSTPIATENSTLGSLLSFSARATNHAPVVFIVIFVLVGAGAGVYGQDVDRTFDTDDFLPPEEVPGYITELPAPFAPGEYSVTRNINLLQDRFEASQEQNIVLYVEGPLEADHALESLHLAGTDPPDSFTTTDHHADSTSIITVIQDHAETDPEFANLVARNDRTGNGIPDRNLDRIYDDLHRTEVGPRASQYLSDDRRSTRIEYPVDADADQAVVTADARSLADSFRFDATPTGEIVVFQAVTDLLFISAIQSMILAIGLTGLFLVLIYGITHGRPLLGLVNLFPILLTVALLVATMRAIGMPLNALTATILAITIGVGVAYSVHIVHRFIDEYGDTGDVLPSLVVTLSGTGGALTGSMLTTSTGMGALILAITPVLGDFGLLMAISVFYAYLSAIIVLPPALFLWARYEHVQGSFFSDRLST